MVKNLVYDWEIRRHKIEQDNKKITRKVKYPINVVWNWLASDYPLDWTIDDKVDYLKKKLPPRKWKTLKKIDWKRTAI